MAKVLISPIGTGYRIGEGPGAYKVAQYRFEEDDQTYTTSFIATALAEKLQVDKILFIGTAKSMWDEIYYYFATRGNQEIDIDYWDQISNASKKSDHLQEWITPEILQKTMKAVDQYLQYSHPNSQGGSRSLIIKYGLNEGELLHNFALFMELTDCLEKGDQIYLDITHAFRSIPLFMYLMVEFLGTLQHKNIEIRGLYYGMLEARRELGYAPIVDLKTILDLSKWIRGSHEFIQYGSGYVISELIKGEAGEQKNLIKIAEDINDISELVNINYLTDLRMKIQQLRRRMDSLEIVSGITSYILPQVKEFIVQFTHIHKDSLFQLELSNWYFKNKRYGYGYICLVESILTHFCEVYQLDIKDYKQRERMKEIVKQRKLYSRLEKLSQLSIAYWEINSIRRQIAHAAFYEGKNNSFEATIQQAEKYHGKVRELLTSQELLKIDQMIPLEDILISKRGRSYG